MSFAGPAPGLRGRAVITLAVGIGTMTLAFSAVNALFLAGPPIDAAGAGLIAVRGGAPEDEGASFREFEAFARDVPALDVSAQTIVTLSRRRGDGVAIAWGLAVTDNYFGTIGVNAAVGRTFSGVNELSAVISHRFWREELDEASLTGLTLPLNGLDVPVIGVLASDFRAGFYDADVWVRISDWEALRLPARIRRPDVFLLTLLARLRPQATKAQADGQLHSVASELARAWPPTNARRPASFVPFGDPVETRAELDGSRADAQSVVISETMARGLWPSTDPVGQWVSLGAEGRRAQVVGVAADTIHRTVSERPEPYVYLPFEQAGRRRVAVVLRTAGDPQILLRTVSDQIRAMDPALPIYQLRTMQQRIDAREQSGNLIVLRFFGISGGLALFLSVVGLTGTVSYFVGQRVQEFSIRAAISASPADQVELVLGSALSMAGPGVAVGLFGALLLSWLITSSVRGLDVNSPMTYAIVGFLQLTIAVAAAAVPGRRAARANPLAALRTE